MVSLIPFHRESSLSGGRVGRWKSTFATLSTLHGDVEEHATLLCSLLLGWGLNAYVALGTIHSSVTSTSTGVVQLHTWVATFCETGKVLFWESLTGEQVLIQNRDGSDVGASVGHHFKEVWAIFRHDEFVVNTQVITLSVL